MGDSFDGGKFDVVDSKDYEKADELALRQFRKNIGNPERRKRELELLLKEELEKPEELRDPEKIAWLQEELRVFKESEK